MSRMDGAATERVDWLRQKVDEGTIHTVRLSFGDHLGAWRGKRIPAAHFLEHHLDAPMGFCDGMIVCDVRCDIIQETPFSNFTTGYPDFHVWPDLERMRLAAWAPGEAFVFGTPADHHGDPAPTAPAHILERVVGRLAEHGLAPIVRGSLGGRFMQDGRRGAPWGIGGLAPAESTGPLDVVTRGLNASGLQLSGVRAGPMSGEFEIGFADATPRDLAESFLVAKGACKEIGAAFGTRATFMTRTVGGSRPSVQRFDATLQGFDQELDVAAIQRLVDRARGLFQPSITAFKAGPPSTPSLDVAGDRTIVRGMVASAEADPFVALAACLAAVGESLSGKAIPDAPAPRTLPEAADALEDCEWASDWLGSDYVENTIPLLRHEGALFDEVVSDWEIERYWSAS